MRSADEPDDAVLWSRAAGGDGGAFGELFERHADRVYNHCFRRTGSWDTAADSTAMVFLEAWRRRGDVQLTTSSILPWLLAVANNVIRHQRRTQLRHRKALERLGPGVPSADHADDVAARVDDEATMQHILGVLVGMSAIDRDVLSLCLWSQVSYDDAAAVLGIPVGTVRSRLSRATQRLRSLPLDVPVARPVKAGESS